jgi:hypothetical protein
VVAFLLQARVAAALRELTHYQGVMKQFLWKPGAGMDPLALERLRAHFRKPAEPMGEAWFMGEQRRMFPKLLGDLGKLRAQDLQRPLEEIAGGICAFGLMEEWRAWYHYLLGVLLPRSHEAFVSYLLESLMTGFMAIYPNGIYREPYAGFRDDVLCTLGRCMMDGMCWNGPDIAIGKVLHRSNDNPNRVWGWWDASGDFTSSMFFCLKYLPAPSIEPWLHSVFDIPSPHWRAQVIVWLVGAHGILNNVIRWPSEFSMGLDHTSAGSGRIVSRSKWPLGTAVARRRWRHLSQRLLEPQH